MGLAVEEPVLCVVEFREVVVKVGQLLTAGTDDPFSDRERLLVIAGGVRKPISVFVKEA